MKKKKWVLLSFLIAGGVIAAGVSIDGRTEPYRSLSNVNGTSTNSDSLIRNVGLTQAAATYRLSHGPSSLPAGSTFRMTWPNGSSEGGAITSTTSSLGAVPIPNTQCPSKDDCGVNFQPQ